MEENMLAYCKMIVKCYVDLPLNMGIYISDVAQVWKNAS